ncbi:30S ribosomal protein S4e [Methanosalsum natronophilum]|uniref:Small ribosomal subunit protein eS4 n=1 Tax=Methanosalsum natronophilum TaxID=768733 RepID=A0A424YM94_9EURY|nr:30S ribosomal protein S4e [Methanosalsum natronophilum]MCS3924752.1 small subunit ribosomal protein S4e [Methanosalsum natronophilum]RQD80058.1 MAG: 30S ribosomal protein S4e [Methanosalsum natronophilum]
MGKHQKRISVPNSWQIPKKANKWALSTRPGPHHKAQSVPLGIVLRDMLGFVGNISEAKKVLSDEKVLVDGIARKDTRFPVGLFDIVSIPLKDVSYIVLLDKKGRLVLNKLDKVTNTKLCKINGKTIIKNGKVQLNLSDGTNIIATNDFKPNDSVIISIPDKEIVKHLEYKEGNLAMVVGGAHSGEIGSIKDIHKVRSSKNNTVLVSSEYDFETIENYIVVVGETEPEIELGGETLE